MNIFVGALPYQLTEDELRKKFEEFGRVISVNIIMDRDTGRSKGFAFVEMDNSQEAKKAISELNGLEIQGRTIAVNEAKPRPSRPGNGFERNNNSRSRSFNSSRNSSGNKRY